MMDYRNTTSELSESGIDTVVIPLGSTEQMGPYLPMHMDTLIAELYAKAYGEMLNAYVLPVLPFNTSEEHAKFKGTVHVSPNSLTAFLEDIIVTLRKQGFRKFVLCCGHGGAYWEAAFVKHINYMYEDIVLVVPHHNLSDAWNEAIKAAGLEEAATEVHGGLLSVCTLMWLCPELVKLEEMGSDISRDTRKYMNIVMWDRLTVDGCWGKFTPGKYTKEQLAEKGRIFWTTFIAKRGEGLMSVSEKPLILGE
ncbi:creatinine amidohydrolase [Alicyclobacillus contaminans]|uniref:creatininase family protein n=1 Tax=Alicyclobacillus contaminans TaxID=392016 RepID=UPI000556B0A8|nr:creatininase family protein [Alicyclobacillus contaminans]GMA48809.1 creatinine amidohydrolase [Alicyclobacillus contaminans]